MSSTYAYKRTPPAALTRRPNMRRPRGAAELAELRGRAYELRRNADAISKERGR